MKTRTLLLLAVACGLAILLAGGVLLVQIATREDVRPPSPLGEEVRVGDMTVIVDTSTEDGGRRSVEIRIGGVEDPDGTAGFRMIASARPAPLVDSCGATTRLLTTCTLVFEVPDDGGSRQLLYDRGDRSARWVLTAPS